MTPWPDFGAGFPPPRAVVFRSQNPAILEQLKEVK